MAVCLKQRYIYDYSSISLVVGKENNRGGNIDNFRELISSDIIYDKYGKLEEMKIYILKHEKWLEPFSDSSDIKISYDTPMIKQLSYLKKS